MPRETSCLRVSGLGLHQGPRSGPWKFTAHTANFLPGPCEQWTQLEGHWEAQLEALSSLKGRLSC